MVRGLYTAASGAIVAQSNVDVIANNLANVDTAGFKRTLMQIEAAPKTALFRDQTDPGQTSGNVTAGVATHAAVGALGFGSRIYDTPTDFEQGAIAQTANTMDVALNGPGFLAVRTSAGNVAYTRGGSFTQNAQNQLVTGNGDLVLDAAGQPLTLQPVAGGPAPAGAAGAGASAAPAGAAGATGLRIDPDGSLTSNGKPAGRLAVYEFANLVNLRPQGASTFVNGGPAPRAATQTTVLQGAQEKSNANVISSMVSLIANERWFDANQKMIQTQDTATGTAITTLGKSTP